jgi:hypothetical protein
MADHPMSKKSKKSLRLNKLVPRTIDDDDLAAVAGGTTVSCAYTACCSLVANKNVTRRAPRRR